MCEHLKEKIEGRKEERKTWQTGQQKVGQMLRHKSKT